MRESVDNAVNNGLRLNEEQSLWCLTDADLWDLGRWAHMVRCRMHPPDRVTYQIDRNINYTNVCVSRCLFCAFSRSPDDSGAYTLSIDEILDKVREAEEIGSTGILLQGGINPRLRFAYYLDMLRAIRARFPLIHIHAFSPPEIFAFSRLFKIPAKVIVAKLIDAGLDSLPGGGAEILVDSVRKRISPAKCSAREWLDVMRKCHGLGLRTTATMVIGFGETPQERLAHLLAIRTLQDETAGFTAFIPWTFQPENTKLVGKVALVGGVEYLRLQAAARLILDNVPHHQVSWLTQGLSLGSTALYFGADDFSSIMIEENVVRLAGVKNRTNEKQVRQLIKSAGFKPVKRLTLYQNILHA
jgi:cyclic dehypoxanthinyl futalosine synthase